MEGVNELVVRLIEADVEEPRLAEGHSRRLHVGRSVGDACPEDGAEQALDASHAAERVLDRERKPEAELLARCHGHLQLISSLRTIFFGGILGWFLAS
jgi:hypothetical protein